MSVDFGVDFRSTSGYVTDGPNDTYNLKEAYPTGRGALANGWISGGGDILPDSKIDRNNALDVRLAGWNGRNGSTSLMVYQIDLPSAGTYDITIAYGDGNSGVSVDAANITVKDNTTTLFTMTAKPSAGQMADAAGNKWSYAAWPGSNVAVTAVFATTTFILVLGDTVTHFSPLAHIHIKTSGGGVVQNSNFLMLM